MLVSSRSSAEIDGMRAHTQQRRKQPSCNIAVRKIGRFEYDGSQGEKLGACLVSEPA